MKQYQVIYTDKAAEYIDAYGYVRHGKTYKFDLGHGAWRTVSGVKAVYQL